ncbi:MAG: maleylacetoacetate isomerase [Woeseia sp.]|nr:maleylacetoacetate isomerase [Woeseia sp.]MBT8096206.1 maleylacetoacetate isomerase [Woeseia sp.]NNE60727.1 maleylacetoacetate isomerase [Woeseia sp.]NNL55254.1 maleylacetoacetate isomerase [Woeseia sp.]
MTLFGYYRSSASYRIRIVLNLKGLPWNYEAVLLNRGEQQQEGFLSRNPSGLVPVLESGNASLSQSLAIAEFIDEIHPDPALLPANSIERARVREIMGIIACDVHPLQNLRVLNWLREELDASDAQVTAWIHRWISSGFVAIESLLEQHNSDDQFCVGTTPTLADALLIPQVYNARRFALDLAPFPRLCAIDTHCQSLAAFADASPERQPDAPQ